MDKSACLELKAIRFAAPNGRVLAENLNVRVHSGELLLISGPNGSGKTSLLNVILKKKRAQAGKISWNMPQRKLGYLPQIQDSEVHLPMTLLDVLRISLDSEIPEAEILGLKLLEKRHFNLHWNRASGGEKRRTLLSRIFINEPDILVLDEPFNHLDRESRLVIVQAITAYLKNPFTPRIAIVVSHEGLLEAERGKIKAVKVEL